MRISDWSSDVCSSDLISLISPGAKQGLRIGAADRNRFSAVLHREAFGDRERETENRMNEGTALNYAMLWIIAIHDAINRCQRSEENTSELLSLMRISYAVFCLKKKKLVNYISLHKDTDNTI